MAACDDSIINIDWQFNVNAWEGDSSSGASPLSALPTFIRYRHYDLASGTMLLNHPDADRWAVESVAYGQQHNPSAQQAYRECAAQLGIYRFFRLVISAAPNRAADFEEARRNIAWQAGAMPWSVTHAIHSWRSSQNVNDSGAKDYFIAEAAHALLFGQHHNASVMQLYRACIRDDAGRLFQLLQATDLRSPVEKHAEIMRALDNK